MSRSSDAPRAFVIGHPIAHSRSPLLHGFWLRQYGLPGSYERIDVAPAALADFIGDLRAAGFAGGNVTIPHKTAVMALADELDEAARAIGAVNTLWFEAGRLHGGNTDAPGFLANLDDEVPGWDEGDRRHALVLGAGGASRAIVYGLRQRGLTVAVANRTRASAEALAAAFGAGVTAHGWNEVSASLGAADLLVNTTSLGMAAHPGLDLDLAGLQQDAVVSDLVYVPLETALLATARARGHRVSGGLGMLLHQAAPGFSRWFGRMPVVTAALRDAVAADIPRR